MADDGEEVVVMERVQQESTMMIIATAHYHEQPPIDTPAKKWTRVKAYASTAKLQDIVKWANEEPYLIKLEIQEDDVGIGG